LSQVNRTGEEGRGLAVAGLVLGYIALAVTVLVVILLIVSASGSSSSDSYY
jgi:hypothetical protein